jgi:hypothetical protein
MSKLESALALAARGFKVFPIAAGAKAPPLLVGWQRDDGATLDEGVIRHRWSLNPDANIGIHCAGLLVVDVDVKNSGDASFARLDMIEGFPDTLTTATPTGGRHLFYRLPDGHPGVQNSAGRVAPGIDIRSTNGYVVAPGSTVPAGEYVFAPGIDTIAPAPEWLVQRCGVFTERERPAVVNVPDAPPETYQRALEWLRGTPPDAGGYGLACGLRDRGLSAPQVAELLMSGEAPAGVWPEAEAHLRATNAFRYAQTAEPGKLAISADDFPTVDVPPAPPRRPRAGPQRLAALAQTATEGAPYLIKGLLQQRSHAVLYGAPGEGKTFVALDMAYHVAAGREWQGRRVAEGLVLYLAFEGMGGIARRAAALIRHYGDADVPLYVEAADYNLREQAGRKALAEMVAGLPTTPKLIVVDTLARAMKGGDENSAQDMGALNDAIGALVEASGACVLVIHHSGKNKANGARGSSALLGAIDTEIEVADRAITPTKQRDLEACDPIGFRLHPVLLGLDADGDEITSCVVMPGGAPSANDPRAARLKGNVRRAWEVLCEIRPQNDPVTEAEWKEACEEFLPQRRGAMYDVRQRLVRSGLIVVNEDCTIQRKLE